MNRQIENFKSKCREHGLRITPQRAAIYEELCRSGKHPGAEQLFEKIRRGYPNISLDTVNRTLLTFAQIGLAEIIESPGGPRRYDPNMQKHHHAHCIECGKIIDFYNKEFDDIKIPAKLIEDFDIIGKRVVINGICSRCRSKGRKH